MDRSGSSLGLLSLGEQLRERATTSGVDAAAEEARAACRNPAFWFWTDKWDAEMAKLRASAADYLPRATAWLSVQAGHPWEAPIADQHQMWVSAEGVRPEESAFEPASGYFGIGAFGPSSGGLWTSTDVPGMASPLLEIIPNWPRHVWALRPTEDARIYEVRTQEDLRQLVSTYPHLAESEPFTSSTSPVVIPAPFYVPDWEAVSHDWDAVRFTMAGKLATVFALLPVADGYTMLIDEFGVESTLWLRWTFESVEDVGSTPGRPVRPRQLYRYQGPSATWPAQHQALTKAGWTEISADPEYEHLKNRERYALFERQA